MSKAITGKSLARLRLALWAGGALLLAGGCIVSSGSDSDDGAKGNATPSHLPGLWLLTATSTRFTGKVRSGYLVFGISGQITSPEKSGLSTKTTIGTDGAITITAADRSGTPHEEDTYTGTLQSSSLYSGFYQVVDPNRRDEVIDEGTFTLAKT